MTIEQIEAILELAERGALSKAEKLFVQAMKTALDIQRRQAASQPNAEVG